MFKEYYGSGHIALSLDCFVCVCFFLQGRGEDGQELIKVCICIHVVIKVLVCFKLDDTREIMPFSLFLTIICRSQLFIKKIRFRFSVDGRKGGVGID